MGKIKDYMTGKMPSEKVGEMQQWLIENENDPTVVSDLTEVFGELASHIDKSGTDDAYRKLSYKLGIKTRKQRIISWAAGIAASIIVPFVSIFAYQGIVSVSQEQIMWSEIRVPDGEQREVILDDGTILRLNAGSRLTYPSSFKEGDTREIFAEGEVFAEVIADPKHPFIINSGDVAVRVLGTKFNFKAYHNTDRVELLLMEGSVNFEIKGESPKGYTIRPGDMIQYDRSTGDSKITSFQTDGFKSFCDNGALHFFNLTLQDIVNDLQRIYAEKIVVLNEELAKTRYFACFSNQETLDQIFDALNADGRMKIRRVNGIIYIS